MTIILEIEQAPLDLSDCIVACMIPYCDWGRVILVIHPILLLLNFYTYAIDPQAKPTSRYPLSDIESEVGALIPVVSNLVGVVDSLLFSLNRPTEHEK